jgi:predicted RNase H-like nuclease (RuvC/YqgF family)
MTTGLTVMVGAVREGLTVILTGVEVTDSEELSVTWSSKLHVPVVKDPVETEGNEEDVHPVVKELPKATKLVSVGDSSSHWQV